MSVRYTDRALCDTQQGYWPAFGLPRLKLSLMSRWTAIFLYVIALSAIFVGCAGSLTSSPSGKYELGWADPPSSTELNQQGIFFSVLGDTNV